MEGVTVIATSPALSRAVSTVTDERGRYTLSELPPGRYRLLFRSPAAPEVQRDNIEVVPLRTTPVFVMLWLTDP